MTTMVGGVPAHPEDHSRLAEPQWCRACGEARVDAAATHCPTCGTPMRLWPADSKIGLVYSVRRRLLGSRPGVCVEDLGAQLVLHMGRDEVVTIVVDGALQQQHTPEDGQPPAGRLLLRAAAAGSASWDRAALTGRAMALAREDVASARVTFDRAFQLGREDLLGDIPLTEPEKRWRAAYGAAVRGDVAELATQLEHLPERGYPHRCRLLLPFLSALASHKQLEPLLTRWAAVGVPRAALLRDMVFGVPAVALPAALWLHEGRLVADPGPSRAVVPGVDPPPQGSCRRWAALHRFDQAVATGQPFPADLASLLPAPMLEDLIDLGLLPAGSDLSGLSGTDQLVVRARLQPQTLSNLHLSEAGHVAELARRHFLSGDDDALAGLPRTPAVSGYQALWRAAKGGPVDTDELPAGTAAVLQAAAADAARLADVPGPVSPAVRADPTVWTMLAGPARDGRLQAEPVDAFGRWVALNRMVGLIWQDQLSAAVELGRRLASSLTDEVERDEAMSLMAYCLHQTGHADEALVVLEEALEGQYTQALLVNASVIAQDANPHRAMALLGRLVQEAPTDRLKVAAMAQALQIWEATGEADLPGALRQPLTTTLRLNSDLTDYAPLLRVANTTDPQLVLDLPAEAGERGGLLRLTKANARLARDPQFDAEDLAREFVAVYRNFGRTRWFDAEWARTTEAARQAMFVDAGDGFMASQLWVHVLTAAPELVNPFDQLQLKPLIAAHISEYLSRSQATPKDEILQRYLLEPYEQLLSARHTFEASVYAFLATNLVRCLNLACLNLLGATRDGFAGQYNALSAQASWDQQNRPALRNSMRRVLDSTHEPLSLLDRLTSKAQMLCRDVVTDTDVTDLAAEVARQRDQWRNEVRQLRSNL